MENLVPLGTGNSRLMKSNIPASTTLAQLIQMWNNGTFPYDIGPLNSAGISQQGTPLNKATLLKDATAALYGYSDPGSIVPDHLFATLSKAALYYSTATPKYQEVTVDLSTAQEGDIVQLEEDGKLADFYVAKLNYESGLNGTGRTLLVRKDCYDNRAWDSGNVNAWASSDLLTWLNGTYKALLGSDIQTAMGTTTYYYTPGNGNNTVTTRSDAVFQLSLTELGKSGNNVNVEGSALPIASTLRVVYQSGSTVTQWTRSPKNATPYEYAYRLVLDGTPQDVTCSSSNVGSRPVFTLPSTFTKTYYVDSEGNLHDQQEYEAAGTTTDVQGNPITIGIQIATGSYVGTGKYGSKNTNILTFEFDPKLVIVTKNDETDIITGTILIYNQRYSAGFVGGDSVYNLELTIGWYPNKVRWFSSNNENRQLNKSGMTYFYFALG